MTAPGSRGAAERGVEPEAGQAGRVEPYRPCMRCFRPSAVGWWWCADHIEQGWAPKAEPTPNTWTKSTHTRYHTKRGVSAPDRCLLCATEAER